MGTASRNAKAKVAVEAAMKGAENDALDMSMPGKPPVDISPALAELIGMCASEPLLSQACLEWARDKKAQMAQAELLVLYGPEKLQAMMDAEQAKNENGG